MTIYGVRQRVACYVTRVVDGSLELLVFEHVDDVADPSRVQVPAGQMATFEAVEGAALREVEEESGLIGLRFERRLGSVELGLQESGGPSVTTYVHLTAPDDGAPSWEHTVSGDGEDRGLTFSWRWERLPLTVDFAAGQAAYLDSITE